MTYIPMLVAFTMTTNGVLSHPITQELAKATNLQDCLRTE
jgi:hypothetical protein